METLTNAAQVVTNAFAMVWLRFVELLPNIVAAIIIFIVGIIVADLLGRIVSRGLHKIYLDQAVDKVGMKQTLMRVGFKLDISRALGLLVTWFLYVVVLIAAAEILGLYQISEFLQAVVLYVPNVIIAVVILVVGIILGNFVATLVKEASRAGNLSASDFLSTLAKWAILVFSFMAALIQLRVAAELIQILFTGVVFMFALAGGLAFGLGGKEKAKGLLEKIQK